MPILRSPLVFVTLIAPIAGCQCPRNPLDSVDAAQATRTTAPRRIAQRFPSEELRAEMRRLHVLTEELKRRARRGKLGNAPTVVLRVATDMPRYAAPKVFLAGLEDLRQRARVLTGSKVPAADYGKLVQSCISCHEQLAPQLVGHVTKLRLDAALAAPPAPTPQRTAAKRPRPAKRRVVKRKPGRFLGPSDGMVR